LQNYNNKQQSAGRSVSLANYGTSCYYSITLRLIQAAKEIFWRMLNYLLVV